MVQIRQKIKVDHFAFCRNLSHFWNFIQSSFSRAKYTLDEAQTKVKTIFKA